MLDIVPHPRRFAPANGHLKPGRSCVIQIPEGVRGLHARLAGGPLARFRTAPAPRRRAGWRHPGEYLLDIRPNVIRIDGDTDRSLFDAVLTLEQVVENRSAVPCGTIRDWPDIPWRGFHLDCKGGFPSLPKLYEFCRELIDLKFNCLLIEYEDRLPYRSVPETVLPGSPTVSQWRTFLRFLRDNHVKPIPLVQTAGHLEFLLRHEAYAALRENGNPNEICLSNPKALKTVLGMLDEVMELHREDGIVHIGADETWHLATCPRCRRRLEAGATKLDVYVDHVAKLAEGVLRRGCRPMMWCDMFWRGETPEKVTRLPREVILAEWVYSGTRQGAPGCYWNGRYVRSDRFKALHPELGAVPTVSTLDARGRNFLRRHWPTDPATGLGPVSPYLGFFMSKGFEVWGVSAARAGQSGRLFGLSLKSAVENEILWARDARLFHLGGVIVSSWSRSSRLRPLYGPWAGPQEAVVAAAQYQWNSETPYADYLKLCARRLYGGDVEGPVREILEHIDRVFPECGEGHDRTTLSAIERIRASAARGHAHLDLLTLWVSFNGFRWRAESQLTQLEGGLFRAGRGMLPAIGRDNRQDFRRNAGALATSLDGMSEQLRRGLRSYYRKEDLDEYIESRLGDLRFRLRNVQSALG